MTIIDTKKIAREKVEKALALIERAQHLISQACGELCPIDGAIKQWKMVGDHYDETKALWHRVNESIPRAKIDLDRDEKRRIEQKQKNTKSPHLD